MEILYDFSMQDPWIADVSSEISLHALMQYEIFLNTNSIRVED